MPVATTWTREHYDALIEHYPLGGPDAVRRFMPHKSVAVIRRKASFLGVKRVYPEPAIEVDDIVELEVEPVPLAFVPKPAREPMTFEDQLAAVANGARLVEVVRIRRPDPTMTLGGVSW